MDRYQTPLVVDGERTVRYYRSALTTDIKEEAIPFTYVAREGDRLDNIAYAFYKSPRLWWVIAKANRLATGTIAVPAGTVLYIPNV